MSDAGLSGRSKRERALPIVLALGLLASLTWLVHPWYDSLYGDSAIYIATARSLAAGEGYSYLGEPHRIRPPGFSLLLAPLLAAGGSFRSLNLFVSLSGALAVLGLYAFQRPRVGSTAALLTALALWLNPGFQRLCNQVMSDVPGLAALLACLLVERWARRAPSPRRELVLGLCVGLSALLRSFTLVLIPAIAAARLLRRNEPGTPAPPLLAFTLRRVVLFAGVALLVAATWPVRNALTPGAPPPSDQTFVYSYATGFLNRDPGDPGSARFGAGEIAARVPAHARQMARVLGARMRGGPHAAPLDVAGGGFLVLLIAGWLYVLWKRRSPAEFAVLFSLAIYLPYFSFRDRLLLPLFALTLGAGVEALRDGLGRLGGARAAAWGVPALLVALIALDFSPREGWRAIQNRHRAHAAVAAAVAPELSPDDRLAAGLGQHYAVHLGRPVYSLVMAMRRGGDRPQAADAILEKYDIDAVLLSPLVPVETEVLLPYLEERYGPAKRLGPAFLIRLPR